MVVFGCVVFVVLGFKCVEGVVDVLIGRYSMGMGCCKLGVCMVVFDWELLFKDWYKLFGFIFVC